MVDSPMLMSEIMMYMDQWEANRSYPPASAAADPVDSDVDEAAVYSVDDPVDDPVVSVPHDRDPDSD